MFCSDQENPGYFWYLCKNSDIIVICSSVSSGSNDSSVSGGSGGSGGSSGSSGSSVTGGSSGYHVQFLQIIFELNQSYVSYLVRISSEKKA